MGGVQEQLVIKFRLHDGSDIGPKTYLAATTVATLKESILAEWPKGKDIAPKTINDVKLINGGRILESNKTLGEYKSPICNLTGGVTTSTLLFDHHQPRNELISIIDRQHPITYNLPTII